MVVGVKQKIRTLPLSCSLLVYVCSSSDIQGKALSKKKSLLFITATNEKLNETRTMTIDSLVSDLYYCTKSTEKGNYIDRRKYEWKLKFTFFLLLEDCVLL